MITDIILGLAVILLSGLLVSKLCKKLHIPSVTGYLIVGLLLSPGLFGLIPIGNGNFFPGILNESLVIGSKAIDMNTLQEVSVSASLSVISEIELGFIAFSIGVEFKKDYVKQLGKKPIILAFSESGFAMILIFAVCMIFYPLVNVIMGEGGFDIVQYVCLSLALGAIGSATAPAATMMVIKQYKAKGPVTNNLIAVVAVDDASALILGKFLMLALGTCCGFTGKRRQNRTTIVIATDILPRFERSPSPSSTLSNKKLANAVTRSISR